jgi:hypothetical protein
VLIYLLVLWYVHVSIALKCMHDHTVQIVLHIQLLLTTVVLSCYRIEAVHCAYKNVPLFVTSEYKYSCAYNVHELANAHLLTCRTVLGIAAIVPKCLIPHAL